MSTPQIVSRSQWLDARKQLLLEEKAFTRQRDDLSAKRRQLPWVKIETDYRFQTEKGDVGLADLFGSASQLIVQHFMLGEGWEARRVSRPPDCRRHAPGPSP